MARSKRTFERWRSIQVVTFSQERILGAAFSDRQITEIVGLRQTTAWTAEISGLWRSIRAELSLLERPVAATASIVQRTTETVGPPLTQVSHPPMLLH